MGQRYKLEAVMQGQIKQFNPEKKYGFISSNDFDHDLFFHISEIKDSKIQCKRGELVNFEAESSKKLQESGMQRISLSPLNINPRALRCLGRLINS